MDGRWDEAPRASGARWRTAPRMRCWHYHSGIIALHFGDPCAAAPPRTARRLSAEPHPFIRSTPTMRAPSSRSSLASGSTPAAVLAQERRDAGVEIVAAVTQPDKVLIAGQRHRRPEAAAPSPCRLAASAARGAAIDAASCRRVLQQHRRRSMQARSRSPDGAPAAASRPAARSGQQRLRGVQFRSVRRRARGCAMRCSFRASGRSARRSARPDRRREGRSAGDADAAAGARAGQRRDGRHPERLQRQRITASMRAS